MTRSARTDHREGEKTPHAAATKQKIRRQFAVNAAHGAFDLWRRTKSAEDARQVIEKFEQLLRVETEDGAR